MQVFPLMYKKKKTDAAKRNKFDSETNLGMRSSNEPRRFEYDIQYIG